MITPTNGKQKNQTMALNLACGMVYPYIYDIWILLRKPGKIS